MKKFVIRMALLSVLMLSVVMIGTAQEFEQVNFEPTYLQNGTVVTDVLTTDIQTRLYAFNAIEGDVITVTMTQTSDDLDPYIVVLGPRGEVIAADDDSGSIALASAITGVTLPADGTYFLMATSFQFIDAILEFESEEVELGYELTISGLSDVETENIRFFAGELVPGQTLTGTSTLAEPVFYYRFDGKGDEVVNLEMSSEEFGTIIHVFAPNGNRIAIDRTNIDKLLLPSDGTYLVFATDIFFYNALDTESEFLVYEGGTFQITLTK